MVWLKLALLIGTALAAPPIDNFHSVVDGKVARGARPDADGVAALASEGFRTVIDLQGGDTIWGNAIEDGESSSDIALEASLVQLAGMSFVSIPLSAISPDTEDQAPQINQILRIITDPKQQPVYFHCRHGSDRTGLIAALYRVLYQGCTPGQAHAEMMDYGHTSLFFWMDHYFNDRVSRDLRTQHGFPASTCPLPLEPGSLDGWASVPKTMARRR